MVKNYRQEDGTYLFPMELAGKKCEEDRAARVADVAKAKLDGYKVDWVKFGYRIFEAVLIPMSEERFKELVRDEDNRQKAVRVEGRCMVSNGNGGLIRCPERIPNPLYGEEGQPKTLMNDCSTCIYNTLDKLDYHTQSLSHSGNFNEDGEEDMEIPCGITSNGELYEFYCERVLQFVEDKFPDNVETMKLLLQEYSRTETAEKLRIHRNTPRNQVNSMKEDLTKMLDDLFAMF
nr:hypothetical protein [uncultured Schaedlerella sp.]